MKRLPIEGLPAERPVCQWCGVKLRAFTDDRRDEAGVLRRVFWKWDGYDDLFHSLGCARKFAVASYRGGYRRQEGR